MNFREELGEICPKIKDGADIYFYGCGKYFEDLCRRYLGFAGVNLEEYAYAFIDDDAGRQGSLYYGKPVVSPDAVAPENSVVMITVDGGKQQNEIERQMMDKGFFWQNDLLTCSITLNLLKRWLFKRIMGFKGKHEGERCFIVGGSPSLQPADLDKLQNEKTFAMNRIYTVFGKTKWRPAYYVCSDENMIEKWDTINENISSPKFLSYIESARTIFRDNECRFDNAYFYTDIRTAYYHPLEYLKPGFGEYPDSFYRAGTTTYFCFQLAVFMGFREIYLIGIDNDFSIAKKVSGEFITKSKERDHFSDNYFSDDPMEKYRRQGYLAANIDILNAGYESAREYAGTHGIKIYNATRGGKLETFERVDFDSLF